jgi:plasmid maintenance system antidote protein VapI
MTVMSMHAEFRDALPEHYYGFLHEVVGALQQRFREHHDESGSSQKDIAERLGWHPARVSRCLSGQANMTMKTMYYLGRGMGCRMRMILEPLDQLTISNQPAPEHNQPTIRQINTGSPGSITASSNANLVTFKTPQQHAG